MRTIRNTIFVVAVLLLVGCSSVRYVPVEKVVRDSTRVVETKYDSIYVFKDRIIDRGKDTIYIKEIETEYRYKLLRDTITMVQRDSIPYEVQVEVIKEVPRKLSIIDKLAYLCLVLVFVWMIVKIIKRTS